MKMDGRLIELAAITIEFARRLEEKKLDKWANWMSRDAERIRTGDVSAIGHLLGAYGGMGSINDVPTLGRELEQLSSRVWALASELWGEVER
jgi:hypothetical protein